MSAMNAEIILEAIKVGGPIALVSIVICGSFIWLVHDMIKEHSRTLKEFSNDIRAITQDCHDKQEKSQQLFQQQIEGIRQDHKIMIKEVITAFTDHATTIKDLKEEIRSHHRK